MVIREEDRIFIKEYIHDGEELIKNNDIDELLDRISNILTLEGFEKDDSINDFGRLAQKVYDNIFYSN